MGSLFLRALIGGVAGLLAWMIIEPGNPGLGETLAWSRFESRFIVTTGALIGLAVGGYNGFLRGGKTHLLRGLILGALFGIIGILIGYRIGGTLAMMLGGTNHSFWPLNIPARMAAMAFAGMGVGAGIGASALDPKRALHGGIGGLIAGLVSGLLFDLIGQIFAAPALQAQGVGPGGSGEVGQVGRGLFSLLLGALIGLFIGLVEFFARNAWVRLTLGRNEGREWAIYGTQTAIGRRENAEIPIFGDQGIAPIHAYIIKQGRDFFLQDAGSGAPTFLNGQPVANAPLHHGAEIMVGNTRLHFLLKGGQAFRPVPDAAGMRAGYPMGYGTAQPPQAMQPTAMPPMAPTQMQPMAPVPVPPAHTMQPTVAVPAYQPATPSMVALDGPLVGQRVQLNQPMEFGRESTMLPMSFDSSASRKHATIAPTPGGIVVNDLGSTNGTFVNGQRISAPTTIRPGDTVRIGATTFRIE